MQTASVNWEQDSVKILWRKSSWQIHSLIALVTSLFTFVIITDQNWRKIKPPKHYIFLYLSLVHGNNNITVLFQISVLSLKKNYPIRACNCRACRPLSVRSPTTLNTGYSRLSHTSSWYLYFKKYFSPENTSSTGFISGEYTGKKTSSITKTFLKHRSTLPASHDARLDCPP